MQIGDFGVQVSPGRERADGYVDMAHGTQYVLYLASRSIRRADATVLIDGKDVGTFRLEGHGTLTLERPAGDQGRFTFFAAGSPEAAEAGAGRVADDQRGLVQVRFRPEKAQVFRTRGPIGGAHGCQPDPLVRTLSASAGVTGLTGESRQDFHTVAQLEYDPLGEVLISLRLVAGQALVRELLPLPQANPVPPPVA